MLKLILLTAAVLIAALACSSTATSSTSPNSPTGATSVGCAPAVPVSAARRPAGSGSLSGSTLPGGVPVYGKDDTAITTAVGQQFAVELVANPSTGFSWTYAAGGTAVTLVDQSAHPARRPVRPASSGSRSRRTPPAPTRSSSSTRDRNPATTTPSCTSTSPSLDRT